MCEPGPRISAQPAPPSPAAAAARPAWLQSNWKWFVPALGAAGLIAIAFFALFIFSFVRGVVTTSDPYKIAVERAQRSPQVISAIGEPIRIGWLIQGEISYTESDGNADLRIPISGPRGRGEIILDAKKHGSRWTFQKLEVQVMGLPDPILLLRTRNESFPNSPGEFI